MVYWSGSVEQPGADMAVACPLSSLLAAAGSLLAGVLCPPNCIPLLSLGAETSPEHRGETCSWHLPRQRCVSCASPCCRSDLLRLTPGSSPTRIVRKMPAFPATFRFKAEPYSKWPQSCSLYYAVVLSEKSCNRETSLWHGRLMPLGLSPQEWTVPCSQHWCVENSDLSMGWKFWSANEHVWEMHVERSSIYFVQGRIPSHSEQIYYKSVLP